MRADSQQSLVLELFNFISFVIAGLLQESIFVAIFTSVERIRNCEAFKSLFLDGAQAIKIISALHSLQSKKKMKTRA